jgi:K+-sensing histidine kinase KdpD
MLKLDRLVLDRLASPQAPRPRDYAGGVLIVALGLLAGTVLRSSLSAADVVLMLLIAVQITAIIYGLGPALAASLASTLGYNFLFIPPLYTFTVADPQNLVTLFFFAVAALITSSLTALIRSQILAARNARLEAETEKLRSALLTSVSHDLRTPLASILGSATSLKAYRTSLDDGAQRQLLDTIEEEAERLDRFIADLLDMTKLEAGAVELKSELVDIADIVGSALRRAGGVLIGYKVATDLAQDVPMVRLDPVLFEQVLFNLLDNAAKYASAGTAITIVAARVGSSVVVEVLDEGEGIPPADLERVFEKFYRVRGGDRQRAGSGLGLAICRRFVQAMGGSIVAANREDRRGAIFTIEFPVPASSGAPAEHTA